LPCSIPVETHRPTTQRQCETFFTINWFRRKLFSAERLLVSELPTKNNIEQIQSQFTQQLENTAPQLENTQETQETQPQDESPNLLEDTPERSQPPLHQESQPTQTQPPLEQSERISGVDSDDDSTDLRFAQYRARVDSHQGEQEDRQEQVKIDEISNFEELVQNRNFDQDKYFDFMDEHTVNPCDYVVWNVAEVKEMVLLLVKAREQLHALLHGTSGSHSPQPQDFVDRALSRSGTSKKVGVVGLVYFYWKSKSIDSYDDKFSPFLNESMKGDSSNVAELLDDDDNSPAGKYITKEEVCLDKMTESLSSLNSSTSRFHKSQEELTEKMTDLKEEQLKKGRMETLDSYEKYYDRKKEETSWCYR